MAVCRRKSCCCKCKYHLQDNRHCTTDKKPEDKSCVCNQQKGWICSNPEMYPVAHSGWSEHGECECFVPIQKSVNHAAEVEAFLAEVRETAKSLGIEIPDDFFKIKRK